MASINLLVSRLRKILKNQAPLLAKLAGLNVLNKARTEALLTPWLVTFREDQPVRLPRTARFSDKNDVLFEETVVTPARTHIWFCQNIGPKTSQLRNGSITIDGNVLDTDFGTAALLKDLFILKKRTPIQTDILLAPWSHYWGGYYDYLIFVAAKLCRMKDALPGDVTRKAVVAYPLLHTAYERELLNLLGFDAGAVVDSRTTAVRFKTCVLGDNGTGWFYPNKADIMGLRKQVMAGVPSAGGPARRIYISRAGRRQVTNEDELIRLLKRYDFHVIDDKPRSVAEQVAIYSNASFIIGPHGASFANVVWCNPGTHLFELFAPNYAPDYFRYLAHLLGLPYAAYCSVPIGTYDHSYVNANITVSISPLEEQLAALLENSHSEKTPDFPPV